MLEGRGQSGGLGFTYSLHCSSFLGLPFRILNVKLVKPKKGTTREPTGRALEDLAEQAPNHACVKKPLGL